LAAKRKRLRAPGTESRFTAVLESIQLQNRIGMEAVSGLRTDMQAMRSEMTRRFDTLEAAVLELSHRVKALELRVTALEEAVRKNTEDIQRLREQVAELTVAVQGKVEARDFAALAERVARLEARVGL
jgi:predicted nuclease with TOPRIM domain